MIFRSFDRLIEKIGNQKSSLTFYINIFEKRQGSRLKAMNLTFQTVPFELHNSLLVVRYLRFLKNLENNRLIDYNFNRLIENQPSF